MGSQDNPQLFVPASKRFATYLRELRMELGIRQVEVARLLNYSPSVVSRWESGRLGISLAAIRGLSQIYNIHVDKLLDIAGLIQFSFAEPDILVPAQSQILLESKAYWDTLIQGLRKRPEEMYNLSPRKFEELVAELLDRQGLETHLTSKSKDGGRDILAFLDTSMGRHLYLVECKRYSPELPVGVALIRSLYGQVISERATGGLLVTTSQFTQGAVKFGEDVQYQISLKDFKDLVNWLQIHYIQ